MNEKQACDTRVCEPEGEAQSTAIGGHVPDVEVIGASTAQAIPPDAERPGSVSDGNLPVIAERLIDASVRGRSPKGNYDMV